MDDQALAIATLAATEVALTITLAGILAGIALDRFTKLLNVCATRAWEYLKSRITVTTEFGHKDPAYDYIDAWFCSNPRARAKARRVKVEYNERDKLFVTVPGAGTHWLWYHGPMWVSIGTPQKTPGEEVGDAVREAFQSASGAAGKDQYKITMLSGSPEKMTRFMNEVVIPTMKKKERNYVDIYNWIGYWNRSLSRKRPMETVYLPADQKEEIIRVIKEFIEAEERYLRWGIPYRLGIELRGTTGTGKTTIAKALASLFERPIYCMNLSLFASDESMTQAFRYAHSDGFIMIEDIDSFSAARKRAGVVKEEDAGKAEIRTEADVAKIVAALNESSGSSTPGTLATTDEKKTTGPTLSGLLNAIDGLGASEGRVLIITTNDHNALDPALVRSARIDAHFVIGPLHGPEVAQMFRNFFPDRADLSTKIEAYATGRVRQTAAVWQKLFIDHSTDVDRLMRDVIEPALQPYR